MILNKLLPKRLVISETEPISDQKKMKGKYELINLFLSLYLNNYLMYCNLEEETKKIYLTNIPKSTKAQNRNSKNLQNKRGSMPLLNKCMIFVLISINRHIQQQIG